jgi:NTP pyrophosphatase (non-canonical NTP hydrolase)
MTIEQLQQDVDHWITTTGVRYFEPLTNLGILMEEVGEMSRILVRTHGEQSFKKADEAKNLADEMADVLWVLTALANQCNINLTEAMQHNFLKKTNRDSDRHQNNPKLK